MQLRVLFSIVNIAIFLVLFALEFILTQYSALLFYILLGWFVGSFLVLRLPFMSRTIGRPTPQAAAGPASAPLPSSTLLPSGGVDASEIGFCPHCGTHVAPGTLVCPACGRSTRIG
jgi:zinc-ribbon domain